MLHPLSFLVKLPVLLLIYLSANVALAQVYNSSISSATGGTGRATVEAGDASFLNPAALVHLRGRYFFSSVAKDEYAVTLSDNTLESAFPAAFGFVQRQSKLNQTDLDHKDMSFSVADFVMDRWTVGITGHYVEQRLGEESYHKVNGDIGFVYTPRSFIGVGLVVYNVMDDKSDIPEELKAKRSAGAGFTYIYRKFARMRLDATTESEFMAGVETYLNPFIVTRIGYSDDTDDERQLFTGGLGFKGPRFALNYAYEGNPQNSEDYRHSVDFSVPF